MSSARPRRRWGAVVGLGGLAQGVYLHQKKARTKEEPISGVPFLLKLPLQAMPTEEADDLDSTLLVTRERFYNRNSKAPSACDLGENPTKADCLAVQGRECMWVSLASGGIRNAKSACMPCEIDRAPIPCWNVGATVGGDTVEECSMQCPHQSQIRQPQYACVEESGFLTQAQCFDLGTKSNSRCMYLTYENDLGVCAPCEVAGTGTWDCPSSGKFGKVVGCESMCAAPPPPLPPHITPPKDPPESPGLRRVSLGTAKEMVDAPFPVPPPAPPSPEELVAAATAAREAAALASGTTPAPPLPFYAPVVMYRKPEDYMAQTPILDR
eukprot:g12143.t1